MTAQSPSGAAAGALVVGESLVDITADRDRAGVRPGGSPLNVAVGMARLGVPTTLATQLGRDAYGDVIRSHLAASGVELLELPPGGPTGSATVELDGNGAATYAFDLRWDPAPLRLPTGFRLLHLGSLGATLAPGAQTVAELARQARDAGLTVSLDPNVRTRLTPDVQDVRRRVRRLAAVVDVVKLSDEDAAVLFDGRSHTEVLDDLLASGGPGLVVLTLGGDGALLATASAREAVPAPQVAVVDSIGAGDSFMAALLTALPRSQPPGRWNGADLEAVGSFACRAAAITCSRAGADPPWRSELPSETWQQAGPDASYPDR